MTHLTQRRRGGRALAYLLVGAMLSTLAVLAPTPSLAEESALRTLTESIPLPPAVESRLGDAVAAAEAAEIRAALLSGGRRSLARDTGDFVAIGLTLPAVPATPVLARTRSGGEWTPWFEIHFDPAETPDPELEPSRPGAHSAPVWIGSADGYEIDAPTDVQAADVHMVGKVGGAKRVVLDGATASGAGAPAINPRSAWGARAPKSTPVVSRDLRAAVVHHSVTTNGYTAADVPSILRSIQAYHQDVNGWNDIAYNFAVDRDGRAWEARAGGTDRVVLGGHSMGFNTGTVGIVVLGDFSSTTVPDAALETVAHLIAWKFAIHRVDPASTVPYTSGGSTKYPAGATVTLPRVAGHRDLQSTSCPGDGLYSKLGEIRSRVTQLVPGYQAGALPDLLGGDFTGDGLTDPYEYRAGTSPDTLWRATVEGTFAKQAWPAAGTYRTAVGDFDGNGYDDILWHGTGTTGDGIWWSSSGGFSAKPFTVSGSYEPVVGDFDGDGRDDIYWYSAGLAPDGAWYFNADRSVSIRGVNQDLSTAVPLVGDFTGDGRDDIFWYGPGSTADALWTSNGRSFTGSSRSVGGHYEAVVVNANLDPYDDILWTQPNASSASYRWDFGPGATHTGRQLPTANSGGTPIVGDYDGDGRDDVLIYVPGTAPDALWYSTNTSVDARYAQVTGTYSIASGPMNGILLTAATHDLLFVSLGSDYVWHMGARGTYSGKQVG